MANQVAFDIIARDNASRTFRGVGDAADGAGKSFKGLGHDATELDKSIATLEERMHALRLSIAAAPDDKVLRKQLRSDSRELNFLTRLRKDLTGDDTKKLGQDVGKALSSGIGDTLGAIPSQLRGSGIAIGVGVAAVAAPFIGSAIGAAVIGGVGLGGIAGGIAAAAQDSRVKEAGEHLGTSLMGSFTGIGKPFVDPLIHDMGRLEGIGSAFFAKLGEDIAPLAGNIDHLTDGIAGFARNLDFSKAVKAAGPLLDILGDELPQVGQALTDMLGSISDESGGLAVGLKQVLDATESVIRVSGDWIGYLSAMNEQLTDAQSNMGHLSDEFLDSPFTTLALGLVPLAERISSLGDKADGYTEKAIRARGASDELAGGLHGVATDAEKAAAELLSLSDAFDKAFNKQMNLQEANANYKQGIRDLTKELKDGERTLNENTQAGHDNAANAREWLRNIEDVRTATIAQTGDVKGANKTYQDQVLALKDVLLHLGYDKKAVEDLIAAYLRIPKLIETELRIKETFSGGGGAGGESHPLEHRASGGSVKAGRSYIVNENGIEILTAGTDGYVHNAKDAAAMMSGASGGSSMPPVNLTVNLVDHTGTTMRSVLITDALGRGVSEATIAEAYP